MSKYSKILSYLLYFFVFLLPWQTRLILDEQIIGGFVWEYGQLSIYTFDIIFLLMAIIFIFTQKKNFEFSFFKKNIYPILFFLFLLVSLIWSTDSLLTGYFLLRFLQVFVLIGIFKKINFSRLKAFGCFCFSLFLSSILGLWQFFVGHSLSCKWLGLASREAGRLGDSVVWNLHGDRFLRAYGSFPHPNILAGFLAVTLLVLFYLFVSKRIPKKQKIIWLFFVVVFLTTLIFTFSRAGYLALFLGLGFIYLLGFYQNKKKQNSLQKINLKILNKITLVIVTLYLVIFNFYPSLFMSRFGFLENDFSGSHSETARVDHLGDASRMIKNNFWGGIGLGAYTKHLQTTYPEREVWHNQPAHNVYLLSLAELGIFGFMFLWLGIFYFFKKKWADFHQAQKIIIFVILFLCLFDHFWWTNISSLFLASFLLFYSDLFLFKKSIKDNNNLSL
jgi:O-antigen ligase